MTNALQQLIYGMSAQWALERSESMMTLGEMIAKLDNIDQSYAIVIDHIDHGEVIPTDLMSYRGYYRDLAINYEKDYREVSVNEFSNSLKEAIGKTYTGYKGGDFIMSKITPMWVDGYGSSNGIAVSDIVVDKNKCIIKTVKEDE